MYRFRITFQCACVLFPSSTFGTHSPIAIPLIRATNMLICSESLFFMFFPIIAFCFLSVFAILQLSFLLRTYQFMGVHNLCTPHPSLYITVNLSPPTFTLPYKAIGYKTFLSYSSVFRLLQVFPFTLSSSPIFFFCLSFIFAPDDKYQWLSLVEAVLIP
jgi:hypothetical protein